jgi:hypothetical protein
VRRCLQHIGLTHRIVALNATAPPFTQRRAAGSRNYGETLQRGGIEDTKIRVSNATIAVEEAMDDLPGAERRRGGRRSVREGVSACGADSPMQKLLSCEVDVRRLHAACRRVCGGPAPRPVAWNDDDDANGSAAMRRTRPICFTGYRG